MFKALEDNIFSSKMKTDLIILRETDSYIVTRGLSDLSNLDSL